MIVSPFSVIFGFYSILMAVLFATFKVKVEQIEVFAS